MDRFMLGLADMRRGALLVIVSYLAVAAACETSPSTPGPDAIHPQPQPNGRDVKVTSPCTAATCGAIPNELEKPHCKPEPSGCAWSEDAPVSYRACADSECGFAPGAEVCPPATTFKGAACGSENDGHCTWRAACAPPPSTT